MAGPGAADLDQDLARSGLEHRNLHEFRAFLPLDQTKGLHACAPCESNRYWHQGFVIFFPPPLARMGKSTDRPRGQEKGREVLVRPSDCLTRASAATTLLVHGGCGVRPRRRAW